jgi:hypothetical protein
VSANLHLVRSIYADCGLGTKAAGKLMPLRPGLLRWSWARRSASFGDHTLHFLSAEGTLRCGPDIA